MCLWALTGPQKARFSLFIVILQRVYFQSRNNPNHDVPSTTRCTWCCMFLQMVHLCDLPLHIHSDFFYYFLNAGPPQLWEPILALNCGGAIVASEFCTDQLSKSGMQLTHKLMFSKCTAFQIIIHIIYIYEISFPTLNLRDNNQDHVSNLNQLHWYDTEDLNNIPDC